MRTAARARYVVGEGLVYDSDAYNDDTPYFVDVDGRRHLVLPYAFDTNDMQFQHTQRFNTANSFADYVCDAFDWLWEEGAGARASVGRAAPANDRPARADRGLRRILAHIAGASGAWITSRHSIAKHWIEASG